MEPARATNDIIDGRYRLLHRWGQGSSGTTYAAEVLETGHAIALKDLSLLADWVAAGGRVNEAEARR